MIDWKNKYKKTKPKVPDTLAEDETKARELGLSYGEYTAYRDSGYLPTYIANLKKKSPKQEMSLSRI